MANGSFLLTYATHAALVADTGQPDGTFAQVIDDSTPSNNANYQSTTGAWSTVADNLFGVDVPDLLSSGASTTLLNAAIKAGEVHLIAHGYAKADGSTDDSTLINAIGAELELRGGGKIIFDRPPPGGYYRIASPILLRSNVTFEGVDASVLIHNDNTATDDYGACFHGNGMAQSNYGYYTKYDLDPISEGDHDVTCSVPGSAAHFQAGDVVLIFSKDGESPAGTVVSSVPGGGTNFIPFFSRQYRVTDVSGEVISLDYPVDAAVAHPVICDGTGGHWSLPSPNNNATKLVDRVVVRNLRVAADDASFGKVFDSGMYDSLVENVWVDKAVNLFSGNGMARSEFRRLRGFFSAKAMECTTGSHDCIVRDVHAAWSGSGTLNSFVAALEYSANMVLGDFKLFAPDGSPTNAAFNVGQTTGLTIRDGYARFNGKGVLLQDKIAVSTSDVEFRNVVMDLTNQTVNFDVTPTTSPGPYSHYPSNIRLRNVRFTGDTPSTAAMRFTQSSSIDFYVVDAGAGDIDVGSGNAPTGRMNRITYGSWSGTFTDIYQLDKRDMIRTSGQGAYAASQVLINTTSTSTSANNVVATYALPSGLSVIGRDQIVVEATGSVGTNTAAAKTIAFDDGHGVVLSQTIAAGDTGAFVLRAVVTLEGNTVTSTTVTFTYPVSPATHASGFLTTTAETRRTGLTIGASGLTITLQGWVGGAGPTITFNSILMYPKLYGD